MKHIGVTTLDGILARCRVDEETGCWGWAWGMSGKPSRPVPTVHIGAGVLGFSRLTAVPAYRAAWLFSGRKVKEGQIVYRTCGNCACVAPDHLRSGTRQEMYAFVSSTGRNKGQPHRKVANAKNRQKMMLPAERVRAVEQMLAEGKLQREIREALRMCGSTIRRIRLGQHPQCSSPPLKVVRGASVFSLGAQP